MKIYTDADLRERLKRAIDANGLRSTARSLSLSPTFISQVMKGERGVSETLALALGFELIPPTPVQRRWRTLVAKEISP
jgi:hypothetical protein